MAQEGTKEKWDAAVDLSTTQRKEVAQMKKKDKTVP